MIHVGFITAVGRLRDLDPAQVSALAESIKEVGLLNPITVYPREIVRSGQSVSGYGIIAGAHRFEACKSLGWQEIPAVVVDLDDDDRVIAECDENLCGTKLTASEQAMFTVKRKEAYLRKHPETAAHVAGGKARQGSADDKLSFADDQAAKTGENKRTVERNAERGEKIAPAALAMVKGTRLDKGSYLDGLKGLTPEQQCAKVKRDLVKPPKKPKKPKVVSVTDADEEQTEALKRAWNKASSEARRRFMLWLEDEETPVFERTEAGAA